MALAEEYRGNLAQCQRERCAARRTSNGSAMERQLQARCILLFIEIGDIHLGTQARAREMLEEAVSTVLQAECRRVISQATSPPGERLHRKRLGESKLTDRVGSRFLGRAENRPREL